MNAIPVASNKFSIFNLRSEFCISLLSLVIFAVVLVAGFAVAEQGFALIGTWQHVQKDSVTTLVFYSNGTFHTKIDIASGGSGHKLWRGTYRATGASSWVAYVQAYQFCGALAGSCNSCPRQRGDLLVGNGCARAKEEGLPIGVPLKRSAHMQGPDTFVIDGTTFRRVS
jgi:hypothetical protein